MQDDTYNAEESFEEAGNPPAETEIPIEPEASTKEPGSSIAESDDFTFKTFKHDEPTPVEPIRRTAVRRARVESDGPPAVTIQIQSWATPIVGVVMLLIGLVGGYLLRPAVSGAAPGTPLEANESTLTGTATATAASSTEEDRQALMAALVPQVRHFIGDPDAPITLIEFSDFQ